MVTRILMTILISDLLAVRVESAHELDTDHAKGTYYSAVSKMGGEPTRSSGGPTQENSPGRP